MDVELGADVLDRVGTEAGEPFLTCLGKISLALRFPEDVQQEVCDASEQQETGVTALGLLCLSVMPTGFHRSEMFTITR